MLVASVLALAFAVPASEGSAQTPDRQSAFGLDLRDYGGFVGLNLRRLRLERKGRNLKPGEARRWTRESFWNLGLYKLMGTVRYPETA